MDRTQPLPAPAGYKWHVSKTYLKDLMSGRPVFALELWLKEIEPSDDLFGPQAEVREFFDKENYIRRASKHALRALRDKLSYDELTRRVVGPR